MQIINVHADEELSCEHGRFLAFGRVSKAQTQHYVHSTQKWELTT